MCYNCYFNQKIEAYSMQSIQQSLFQLCSIPSKDVSFLIRTLHFNYQSMEVYTLSLWTGPPPKQCYCHCSLTALDILYPKKKK